MRLPPVRSTDALLELPDRQVLLLDRAVSRSSTFLGAWLRKGGRPTEAILRLDWYGVDQTKQISGRPVAAALRRFFTEQEAAVIAALPAVVAPLQTLALRRHLAAHRSLSISLEAERAATILQDAGTDSILLKQDPAIGEALLDVEAWSDEIERVLGPHLRDVAERGFTSGAARAGVTGADFSSDHPVVARSMFDSLSKARGVNTTTARVLSHRLEQGLIDGLDLGGLERIVRGVFTEARAFRTRMITRTTVAAGFEAGQVAAYDTGGVEKKAWLTERDGQVREGTVYNHVVMDGVEVPVMDPFLLPPGELLMFPADPSGSAGNVINCRCTTRPVIK